MPLQDPPQQLKNWHVRFICCHLVLSSVYLQLNWAFPRQTTGLVSVEENPRTLANGYLKWPELERRNTRRIRHHGTPLHKCCESAIQIFRKDWLQWIPMIHIDSIYWYELQITKQSVSKNEFIVQKQVDLKDSRKISPARHRSSSEGFGTSHTHTQPLWT